MIARLTCALLLAGCSLVNDPDVHRGGHPDAGTDAGPPMISAADLCTELVRLFCEARMTCCPTVAMESFEECRADVMTGCQDVMGPLVADRRTGYDPLIAAEIVAEARRLYQDDCNLAIVEVLVTKEGLLSMFQGTAPEGTGCSIFDPPTLLSCQQPGLICQPPWLTAQCRPLRGVGEACHEFDLGCETGLHCPPGAMSTCAPQLADGAGPCVDAPDCRSYVCDATTMRCAARTRDVYCLDPFAAFQPDRMSP